MRSTSSVRNVKGRPWTFGYERKLCCGNSLRRTRAQLAHVELGDQHRLVAREDLVEPVWASGQR